MPVAFPGLQVRHPTFLARVESATLVDLLDHLRLVDQELLEGNWECPSDPRCIAVDTFLSDIPDDLNPVAEVRLEIKAVETLIAEHGNRPLKEAYGRI